jgi:hypothetical protein
MILNVITTHKKIEIIIYLHIQCQLLQLIMIQTKQDYRKLSKNETKIHVEINNKIIISNKIKKIKFEKFDKNAIIPNSAIFLELIFNFNKKIKIPKNIIKLSYFKESNIIYKININNLIFLRIKNDKIKNINGLGNIHTLNLSCCEKIKDTSSLGNVHTLNLMHCENITDVSTLGNVHILEIGNCNNIKDLSSLVNVHTLDLYGTTMTNVNEFKNVHKLILTYNRNIEDVSELGNVHTLELNCCENLSDVNELGNVHTLELSETAVMDVNSLGNVHTLDLSYTDVTDINKLTNVHTLDLTNCKNVKDVRALKNVHVLILSKNQKK